MTNLINKTNFGRFSPDGKQYVINTAHTPRHWYNYLWNDAHVSIISQVGQGNSLSQDAMGNRIPLVAARMLFVRDQDSADYWSLNGLPTADENYTCTHGLGYTTIASQHDTIRTQWRVFVPQNDLCEIWTIQLWNDGSRMRDLRLFSLADTLIDGSDRAQAYFMSQGKWNETAQAATIHSDCTFETHRRCINFMLSDQAVSGYDTRQSSFVGYGTWQRPDVVVAGHCHNSACEMEKPLLALQHDLSLDPNQTVTLHFIIGTAFSEQEIVTLREKYLENAGVVVALQKVEEMIAADLSTTHITTPNTELTAFAAHWLKRQITLGTQWARVRHNGYRDLMQDIGAMAIFNPTLALTRCKRVLAYQYSNGYAPRTWLHGQLLDKDFSDNHVWIPFTVYNLVMESGDVSILEQTVKFNDGSADSIYQHVKRAVDYLWADRGVHGLCRIRSGDWNDALNQVGSAGRGVSVWLSMAWLVANQQFCELAKLHGDTDAVAEGALRSAEMRQSIEQHGWDGDYYLRAIDDNGKLLGSQHSTQGTLFLNTQTWAVMAGLPRAEQALRFAERRLQTDLGIIMLENAYSNYDPEIGLTTRKTPGIQENGGVYLHASAFKLVADCQLKRPEQVELTLEQMLPFGRNGEPYVFSNCYFAIEDSYRYGTSGQSWGTGTAGWFYMALLKHVFGLQPELDGLRIDPCLPPTWENCSIVHPFRGATYHISYQQKSSKQQTPQVYVDGHIWPHTLLPYTQGKSFQVKVIFG